MPTTRRCLLAAPVTLLLALGVAACGETDGPETSSGEPDDGAATVTVKTFAFGPDPVVVPAGTPITFVNEDATTHTVTAGTREAPEPDRFDAELDGKGATFELTLDEAGTYDYFCALHPGPGMTATITVEA